METTFITIHNLTPQANILFASESVVDTLGFQPEEIIGKSCFDYFHPDEVINAKTIHGRGLHMDKAAVLNYARIWHRDGYWVGCECVFTIVYKVLVACTSIYRGDARNQRRAMEAPAIRRLFASSPRDPRYHMLEHLSSKFRTPPHASFLEPRAALILNRFTRTLTVMYATNAVSSILGVTPEQFTDKSFYECMQENCLPEAIRCLESAKANDSIAYLRFWRRDPRRVEDFDEEMREASQSSDSEDGGVVLDGFMEVDPSQVPDGGASTPWVPATPADGDSPASVAANVRRDPTRTSSMESADLEQDAAHAIFDHSEASRSRAAKFSVAMASPTGGRRKRGARSPRVAAEPLEIEAVVSCTSDGLVVVLRQARPIISSAHQAPRYENGLFAAPWGANPIRPHRHQPNLQHPFQHGLQAPQIPVGGPPLDELMNSIREVAVFAWSLTGINGNIASYGHGVPRGEAQPPGGLPIWDPRAQPSHGYVPPQNQAAVKWSRCDQRTNEPGDGNEVPYQHKRQEELLQRHYGTEGLRPSHAASIFDAPFPAFKFQPPSDPYHGHSILASAPLEAPANHPDMTEQQDQPHRNAGTYEQRNWF
ncbi:hypothetical protein BUE80_DR012035 [Diplocarpon rosae]|nr:hypothetical protein BUE80_DR012035 [Diplocarpon rosae]